QEAARGAGGEGGGVRDPFQLRLDAGVTGRRKHAGQHDRRLAGAGVTRRPLRRPPPPRIMSPSRPRFPRGCRPMSVRDQLLDDLCAAVSKEKSDDPAAVAEAWKLRNLLADWFEDNNHHEEAACLRWMLENKKRPYHGSSPSASWFNEDT